MVYRVDHGDANPRGISITACRADGDITKVGYTIPISLNRVTGSNYNKTGASVGGFELSANNCLIAGNSVDFGRDCSDSDVRNVFVSVTGTGKSKTAEYIKSTEKNPVSVSVLSSVKLQGKTYKITSVGKGAFKNSKKLKILKIGKNVKKSVIYN